MKKLTIENIDGISYTLRSNTNEVYKMDIIFEDINVKKGAIIYISEKVLQENNIFTYGALGSKYAKNCDDYTDEVIKVSQDDQVIYLQRYYG